MKILFTGGGSGGHFYPLIAVAEEIKRIANEERLVPPQFFYAAPEKYDERLLFENGIAFFRIGGGKLRNYGSLKNVTDLFKTAVALLKAVILLFRVFPDVVVGKGGYGSFPSLFAARILRIPVFIHESDCVPGRVNRWAGRFARRIALSWAQAARFFPAKRSAYTGNPIRRALLNPPRELPKALSVRPERPLILVLGGSQGSVTLNEAILKILPELLKQASVIHQVGENNLSDIAARSGVLLEGHEERGEYHTVAYLQSEELAAAGTRSSFIISRAGSAVFEIAAWGKPSILVPLAASSSNHQVENAYAYMQAGAAIVIEEENLHPAILLSETTGLLQDAARRERMAAAASRFAKLDAAETIAREILKLALKHEQ